MKLMRLFFCHIFSHYFIPFQDISTAEMSGTKTQGEVNDGQETIDNTCLDQSHSTPSQDKQLNYSHPPTGTNKRLADRSPPTDHPVTGLKKGNKIKKLTAFESAINKLQDIARVAAESEDEYDTFAKHIANQLCMLPTRRFILLQDKIQNLITIERLNCLDSQASPQLMCSMGSPQTPLSLTSPPSTSVEAATSYNSSNQQGLDVVQRALYNICDFNSAGNGLQ